MCREAVEGDRLVGIVTDRDLRQASPSPATSLEIHELHSVLEKVKVRDIMTSQVVTATSEMPIEAAARLMLTHLEGVALDTLVIRTHGTCRATEGGSGALRDGPGDPQGDPRTACRHRWRTERTLCSMDSSNPRRLPSSAHPGKKARSASASP